MYRYRCYEIVKYRRTYLSKRSRNAHNIEIYEHRFRISRKLRTNYKQANKEARNLCKEPMADRGLSKNEYIQALDLMGGNGGTVLNRLKFLAMIKFQLHLICRNDDIAHVSKDCIQRSPQFPQFMTVRMKWSKNVREERYCPPQIIVGAMDHKVCVYELVLDPTRPVCTYFSRISTFFLKF